MSRCIELHTWRLSSSYYGYKSDDVYFEDYCENGLSARVYLVPDKWVQKQGFPSRFFDTMKEETGAVGCIKSSLKSDCGSFVPCILHDIRILGKDWYTFEKDMDPVLYIITDLNNENENIVIYQSIENPLYIGIIRNCDKESGWPRQWKKEDIGEIFGLNKHQDDM